MKKPKKKNFLQTIGPGFITGASDDDPSGIATYTQVGAQFGLGQIWTVPLILPLMAAMQEMVARISIVAGQGLSSVVKKNYPRWVVYIFVTLILIANTFNIGADLGAMAESSRLLVPQIPFIPLVIGFTLLILFLEIFISYKTYAKILKWLSLSLFSYFLTLLIVSGSWRELIYNTFVPHFIFQRDYILALTAVLGTTISPYLFVWQSSEEVEEEIALGRFTIAKRKGATRKEIKAMRQDTFIGMAFSQIVTWCIIGTAANSFYKNGIFDISSTAQAASALSPLAGGFASLIFTIGIIGTGLLAIPILSACAAYALAEAFNWSEGLYKKFRQAHGFYSVITTATVIGLLINFIGINPIRALVLAAIINGVVTPPLIAIIMLVANNKKIMGKKTNGYLSNILGYLTLVFTAACAVLIFIL